MNGVHHVIVPAGVCESTARPGRGSAARPTAGIIGRRNEIGDRARCVWVANVENPYSAYKPGDYRQLAVIRRIEQLSGRVGAKTPSLVTEAVLANIRQRRLDIGVWRRILRSQARRVHAGIPAVGGIGDPAVRILTRTLPRNGVPGVVEPVRDVQSGTSRIGWILRDQSWMRLVGNIVEPGGVGRVSGGALLREYRDRDDGSEPHQYA